MNEVNGWVQLAVGALTATGLIGAGLAWLTRRVKRWVAGVAEDSREAARQLTTSNGTTVAQYVERTDRQVKEVTTLAQDTSRRVDAIAALAQENSRRLDEHLLRGHDFDHKPA